MTLTLYLGTLCYSMRPGERDKIVHYMNLKWLTFDCIQWDQHCHEISRSRGFGSVNYINLVVYKI